MGQAKYTTAIVREILAEEGWELIGEYPGNGKKPLYIRNTQVFNNHVCKATLEHWLNGKRPLTSSLVNPSAYVAEIIAKEGWILIGEVGKISDPFYLYHPNKFNGHTCKVTLCHWRTGKRPNFKSVVDKTQYIKEDLCKDGWVLASEYEGFHEPLLLYNPDFYKGVMCRTSWLSLFNGARPDFRSIVNQERAVKDELAQEGWDLVGDYKSYTSKMIITNPKAYDGHPVYITWSGWCQGLRPTFRSLVDKERYVRSQVEKEGWKLIKTCSKVDDFVYIRHSEYFNNNTASMQWRQWEKGYRPRLNNLIDATEYVKDVLLEVHMVPVDRNWKYRSSDEFFRVRCLKENRDYSINWDKLIAGDIPGTPKQRISSAIRNFYHKKGVKKPYSTSVLTESYWKELEEKIPHVPENHHIDHIVCLSLFGQSWDQVVLANQVKNLRLLPAKENIIRGNRLRASELDEYDLWDLYYQAENPMGYELIEDRHDLAS
jgi:hypothetical protein